MPGGETNFFFEKNKADYPRPDPCKGAKHSGWAPPLLKSKVASFACSGAPCKQLMLVDLSDNTRKCGVAPADENNARTETGFL